MIRIGFDIGGSKLAAIALDAGGRELARARQDVPRSYPATLEAVRAAIAGFEGSHGPAAAVGIAVPGHEGSLSYVAGAPVWENLRTFGVYTLLTSTGSWDTGRAITTGIAIAVLGPAILTTLRRAARRAVVRPG